MTQTITPAQFVAKWSRIQQKETAVSQSHFNDVCHLVGHQTPLAYDPDEAKGHAGIQELDDIHTALDTAVLDAYGWPHTLTDEQILERLLAPNLQRAAG